MGIEFTHAEEALQSRLEQWRACAGLDDREGGRLVPREWSEPSACSDVRRGEASFLFEYSSRDTIRAEAARLIERAKAEGFFWDEATACRIAEHLIEAEGCTEHDAYLVGAAPNQIVIRNTAHGIYGPRSDISPGQYLQRLDEYNRTFPYLQIRLIGISVDEDGNAVIWTVQPFVEGREFASEADLAKAMEARGWEQDGQYPRYIHKDTGAIIEDAHTGNVLYIGDDLFPIDVMVEKLPQL